MEATCPNCGTRHNDPYDDTSDWCHDCGDRAFHEQHEDIPLGEVFG